MLLLFIYEPFLFGGGGVLISLNPSPVSLCPSSILRQNIDWYSERLLTLVSD